MHVPAELYKNVRGVWAICILIAGFFVWLIMRDTQPRESYDHVTGKLTYLDKRFGDKPISDYGLYRYIKLDDFSYPIEIYADEQTVRIDSLKIGDTLTAWYILVDDESWPGGKGVNLRYIYKGNKPVYTNNGSGTIIAGWICIGTMFCTCWFAYVMMRRGKMKW